MDKWKSIELNQSNGTLYLFQNTLPMKMTLRVVCMSIIRDFPPFMNEFLRYYKHLGVDHIYMTGEDSFLRNGGLHNDAFVRNAVYEGYISFNFWQQWLSVDQVFYHSQMLAHEDCIYRR